MATIQTLPDIYTRLLEAKKQKGLTYEQIGEAMGGKGEVWIAALLYGQVRPILLRPFPTHIVRIVIQAKPSDEEIATLAQVLGFDAASLRGRRSRR
ncbi:hypothetical protein EWM64_g1744 [Hericium alpestre]|uniref:Multiprotein-bridging factor 1 n=1 Tax=Hericium alpestre TaxID=135208 RepID=A0A4Z0A7E6_9AGAM|nr:hypothetical protein EWM64_g1744 [Hericium alpestre]